MCGIAGIVGGADRAPVERMVRALQHRGPDASGVQVRADAVLGSARLRVIDLEGGAQPMSSPDGRYTIVYNGEIYNFRELRGELEGTRWVFRTRSDTEVLLAACAVWGERALARLNGMFAFALWDAREGTLLAARDPLGKKPFYYAMGPGGALLFASEAKALLASGLVAGELDLDSLDAYLALGYVPPRRSIFRTVRVLPPGHALVWRDGSARTIAYWAPRFDERPIGEGEATEAVGSLVRAAVRRRLVADVPLGAFLSGGLDSSTVVALMAEAGGEVRTFSVGFGDWHNELPYARAVADRYGTRHREIQMDLAVGEMLRRAAEVFDEPLADSSTIPTLAICRAARESVTVVLTGDGGDEMFAGYDWWYQPLVRARWLPTRQPLYGALALAGRLARGLPLGRLGAVLAGNAHLAGRARRFPDVWDRHLADVWLFPPDEREALWRPEFRGRVGGWLDGLGRPGDISGIARAFAFDVGNYLPGDILVKVDRASMAHGLEARSPLLDREVVEFALSLPVRLKLRVGHGKRVFRRAFEPLWPKEVRRRPKLGFEAPEAVWLNRPDVRALVREVLESDGGPLWGVLDRDAVARRLCEFYDGSRPAAARRVWSLLTLALWWEAWAPRSPAG